MKILLCFAISLCTLAANAQIEDATSKNTDAALGITDQNMIDQLLVSIPGVGGDPRDKLQRQSVKPYMMPVRKIGPRGSDLSYALATCLEYYVNLDNNYKDNLSPDYIKLSLENSDRAVNLQEACRFLANVGTVSAAIMPYDAERVPSAVYATQKFQITNYLHIFRPTTKGRQRVFETKKALMRGHPVLIELKASPQLKQMLRTRTWEPPREATTSYPLVLVAYDEVDQAFEVMSSWGKSWGESGYLQIRYDDFEKYAENGYVLVVN